MPRRHTNAAACNDAMSDFVIKRVYGELRELRRERQRPATEQQDHDHERQAA